MSVSIICRPKNNGIRIHTATPSLVISALEKVFGNFPIDLKCSDARCLRAMGGTCGDDNNAYFHIAECIDEFGTVTISAEC